MPESPFSRNAGAERLTAACALSAVGGFLDIYTYLFRGNVFANAVTGNMVLFGLQLADFQWSACGKYLLAIGFYALGVMAAEYLQRRFPTVRRIGWQQGVLLLEIGCLLPIIFIPYGELDYAVNALISFVCALQVQTFRRVEGLPFSSTMCTGNLRSGAEALFRRMRERNGEELAKALRYFLVIGCFIGGAGFGAVVLRGFGHWLFLLAPLVLGVVFFLVSHPRQLADARRKLRKILRITSSNT